MPICPPKCGKPKWTPSTRALISFWIFGLCNNFIYVVLLTGAVDLIKKTTDDDVPSNTTSQNTTFTCTKLGTGVVLLVNILPGFLFKFIAPIFLLKFTFNVKIAVSTILFIISIIIVSLAKSLSVALGGTVITSIASALGEITYLSMAACFHQNSISTFSSGTGGAGIFGALFYAALTFFVKPDTAIQITITIPTLMFLTFLFLLKKPQTNTFSWKPFITASDRRSYQRIAQNEDHENVGQEVDEQPAQLEPSFIGKLKVMKSLLYLVIPLCLVYVSEYLINQGLFELTYYPGEFLTYKEQYRWYQVVYQLGVFISRSSVNLIHVRKTWIFLVFQVCNFIVLLMNVMYGILPNIWIVIFWILFEGFMGGGAYVNTFYRIHTDVEPSYKEFALGFASVGDAFGIVLAALGSVPLHNALCDVVLARHAKKE